MVDYVEKLHTESFSLRLMYSVGFNKNNTCWFTQRKCQDLVKRRETTVQPDNGTNVNEAELTGNLIHLQPIDSLWAAQVRYTCLRQAGGGSGIKHRGDNKQAAPHWSMCSSSGYSVWQEMIKHHQAQVIGETGQQGTMKGTLHRTYVLKASWIQTRNKLFWTGCSRLS